MARFQLAFKTGFGEVVDHTAPWILVGLVVAAAAEPALSWLEPAQIPDPLEVAALALLGIPVYVCASGATPLVAVFLAGGVSPGAGIAFLLAGPATNISTFGILSGMHGRRIAAAFGVLIAVLCVGLGMLVNALFPTLASGGFAGGLERDPGWVQQISLLLLALVALSSLLRQGPRSFFGQVVQQGMEEHEHDHHNHDHGSTEDDSSCGSSCGPVCAG